MLFCWCFENFFCVCVYMLAYLLVFLCVFVYMCACVFVCLFVCVFMGLFVCVFIGLCTCVFVVLSLMCLVCILRCFVSLFGLCNFDGCLHQCVHGFVCVCKSVSVAESLFLHSHFGIEFFKKSPYLFEISFALVVFKFLSN